MKKYPFSVCLCMLLCSGFLPAFGAAPALSVLTATPKGDVQNLGRRAVQVHFNQPVAALAEESELSSDKCPLVIVPAVEGSCRYSGTQTLVFEPSENWPQATRFTVTVPAGFASQVSKRKLAKNYTFSFSSDRVQVMQVLPRNNEHWLTLTPTIYAQFSQPVVPEKIAPFLTLSSENGAVKTAVRAAGEEEIKKNFPYTDHKNIVAISPLSKLQKGEKYTLSLAAGLPAQTGNLGMARAYQTVFFTYPELSVLGGEQSGCLPFTPTVNLSTPVRLGELYRAARVSPARAKRALSDTEKNSLGSEFVNPKTGEAYFRAFLSFIELSPEEPVTVVLEKGMTDIYGNALEQDTTLTLTNNGYCPTVDFSADGRGVLESYLKPYLPISLMNISSLAFRGMRFNKNNFIPFDQQEISYCKEAPLPPEAVVEELTFNGKKNRTQHTYLDLSKLNPTAQDSILFSQVQVARGANEKPCWISSTDNLTDIGITLKTSPENILVWVTSLQTGAPLQGYAVELRDAENRVLFTGVSDEKGFVRAAGWEKLNVSSPRWGIPPIYAFVTSPQGDGVMSSTWNDGMELWRFNIDYTYHPNENLARAYVFTDRGIYRPSETVFIKGLLRQMEQGRWQVPQGPARGRLVVTDGRGEEVLKKEVVLSADYGSFDTSVDIPASAVSGYWNVSFVPLEQAHENEDARAYASFQVQDVKPAEFKVDLRPSQPAYFGGDEARFSLAASYQFGGVLANAPAKWTLRQTFASVVPAGYDDYTFAPYFLRDENWYSENKLILSDSGTLDSKGTLAFRAKLPRETMPQTVYAEASVQSPAHQELFSRTSVTLHPSDFYLGTKVEGETHESQKPVSVRVVALTPEGKPVEATVTAEFYKEQWFSVRKSGLSGRLEWVSEKKRTDFPAQTLQVSKKGATISFTPPEGGSYYVKLTSRDLFGRPVVGGADFFVYGQGDYYGPKSDDDIVKLTADKNEYKVGQTARIQVASPYEKARALVSVEREGILDAWVTEVKGGADFIPVKIKENYLPNVYVSVMLLNGRTDKPITEKLDLGKPQVKAGYVNLQVIPGGKKLVATVKTDQKAYRPGQTVTVDIATKAAGKGVPAEVTVVAVDEGILALTHYQTPDLFSIFYGVRPLSVFTVDNRFFIIGQRSFGEKGENRGGGGSSLSALGGTDVRSNFKFTPFFEGQVKTNEKGRARVSFTLPDNLTTFRVMALAAGTDTFGAGDTTLRVSKPLMITANLPRFVRQGDSFACSAIIHNYEDKKGALSVTASADGIDLTGGTQTLSVPLGQTREVSWPCRAEKTGEASVSFAVRGEKESDGIQQTFSVSSVEKEQFLSANASTQNAQSELLDRPAAVRGEANNRVTVSLASTALVHLKGAVQYLLLYPYDCLEQQFSKIVPLLLDEKMVQSFGLTTPQDARRTVQKVLDNLGNYQASSGGFSYWKNQLPDPYVTAYALDISAQAKAAGFSVPEPVLAQAAQWLAQAFQPQTRRAFAYDTRQSDTVKAYSVYVLARYGQNTQGLFNTLYTQRNALSTEALSYLLLAAGELKQPETLRHTLAQLLENRVVYNPTTAYVNGDEKMIYLHADDVSATALFLTSFLQTDTPLDNAAQFAAWLVRQLNAQGAWKNTASNAAALRALDVYYRQTETQEPHFTATVSLPNHPLFTHTFAGEKTEVQHAWPFAQIFAGDTSARLTFQKQGEGTLYYTVGQIYEPASFTKPAQSGFSVSRTLTALDGQAVSRVQAGERYKITLTVRSAAGRSFVVLEDFVPAGFEVVNTSLATESAYAEEEDSPFTHREIYKDRIAAFADFLPEGTHTFSYEVSATVRGKFAYPAAWASQLYEPEVFGRTASTRVEIW